MYLPYFKQYSTEKFSPVQDLNVKLRGGWEHTIVKTLIFKWRACSAHTARCGSDGRTQQLETPEVGRAGRALSSEMSYFVDWRWCTRFLAAVRSKSEVRKKWFTSKRTHNALPTLRNKIWRNNVEPMPAGKRYPVERYPVYFAIMNRWV